MTERTEETILAATISLLAEGVAVLLFFCMVLAWIAIGESVKREPPSAPVAEFRR